MSGRWGLENFEKGMGEKECLKDRDWKILKRGWVKKNVKKMDLENEKECQKKWI